MDKGVMKALAAVLAAGLASSGLAQGAGAAAAAKSKFDTPCWSPDARWAQEAEAWLAGTGQIGNLDGARQEIMWRLGAAEFPCATLGGPDWILNYDPHTERLHSMLGGARGVMDGPFNRARWTGIAYSAGGMWQRSPDGRFLVAGEPFIAKGALRVFDLKEQMVRSLTIPTGAVTFDSKGQMWNIFPKDGKLQLISLATTKVISERVVEGLKDANLRGGLLLDEAHDLIYVHGSMNKNWPWVIWAYDLKTNGAFRGVLSCKYTGPGMAYCGPADGYHGYEDAMRLSFGPDDPEHRFLYFTGTDVNNFMRLDLEKRHIAAFSYDEKTRLGSFIDSGSPGYCGTKHEIPVWQPNGDFSLPNFRHMPVTLYKRVK